MDLPDRQAALGWPGGQNAGECSVQFRNQAGLHLITPRATAIQQGRPALGAERIRPAERKPCPGQMHFGHCRAEWCAVFWPHAARPYARQKGDNRRRPPRQFAQGRAIPPMHRRGASHAA